MQQTRTDASQLRQLFLLADELERLSRQLDGEPEPGTTNQILEAKRTARRALRDGFSRSCPLVLERLFQTIEGTPPESDDLALALLLLNRRIRDGEEGLTGRELLWLYYDNSYDVLAAVPRLAEGGALSRAELLDSWPDPELDREDPLDLIHALAPKAYARVIGTDIDDAEDECAPFADNVDLVLSLQGLVQAAERRAAKIFPEGLWRSEYGEPEESLEVLQEQLDAAGAEISERLEQTRDADALALNVFRREYGLDSNDMIIIVELLLQEALCGQGALDAIDLLRLISGSERDLLRKRAHFDPSSSLRRQEIVILDGGHAEKDLTGQVSLAGWVMARLLDLPSGRDREIAVDERIEFHRYLDNLQGSADFFRRLD